MSDEEQKAIGDEMMKAHRDRVFFTQMCAPSPYHWIFQQSWDALNAGYLIPGISGMLNAIEASIRFTVSYLDGNKNFEDDLGSVFSNGLILQAREKGLNVGLLALRGEANFEENIVNRKTPVGIVELRNNVCHGNFTQFFIRTEEFGECFVPAQMSPIAADLVDVAIDWVIELARFRREQGLHAPEPSKIEKPLNALR